MAKYSFEFKLKVVEEYLDGLGGYRYLAKKYNIPSFTTVCTWIQAYKEFGETGLLRKRQNDKYTLDFKLNMIESYLTTETSYHELATNFGINNPSLIAGWVSKFRKLGKEGLVKQQGRPSKMKAKDNKNNKNSQISKNDADRIKELEQQVLALKIENEYLKELRRLRLKESQKKNKSQE